MTKTEIVAAARRQLALDMNCPVSEWRGPIAFSENLRLEGSRVYTNGPCSYFRAVSFLGQGVVSADPEFLPWCKEALADKEIAWLFDFPDLGLLLDALRRRGHQAASIHPFYLPDPEFPQCPETFPVRWYEQEQIPQFQGDPRFAKALSFNPLFPDVLAVTAMDGDRILGMAGASADSASLWQIGIDILPEFRGRGLAVRLVTLLKQEILRRGKVPFYGTAVSHLLSQNVAYRSGFFPAWSEMYTKPLEPERMDSLGKAVQ